MCAGKTKTRRASQCCTKIAALVVPALKKVVVTIPFDRAFDRVTKKVPIGDGAHETPEIALIVCEQLFLVGVPVVTTHELMQTVDRRA
jgi:hypothetical protein